MSKRSLLIPALVLVSVSATAQIGGKKTNDPITLTDGTVVSPGDTLYLGAGTDRRGDFVYLYQPANGFAGSQEFPLNRSFARKFAIVKHFKMQQSRRTGEKTVAVINVGGGLNQVADIQSAVDAKEIVAINRHSFAAEAQPAAVIVQTSQLSTADELKKLKGLLDDGTLTKEEYDTQKKKLLEKN